MQITALQKPEIAERPKLDSLTALVVDDERSIRESLEAYLYHLGISSIATAPNGKVALEALDHQRFDYLFMDLMMPEMSGMELLKNLNGKKRTPEKDSRKDAALRHYRHPLQNQPIR